MNNKETQLMRKLTEKTIEIEHAVASALGLGAAIDLTPSTLRGLGQDVEEIIENHEMALLEGDTVEEWQALDRRLASTEIGRLLQERHEIAEQILDLRDAAENPRYRQGLGKARAMSPEFEKVVKAFIRDNPDANAAYGAMVRRGAAKKHAEAEIARVLVACIWEASVGHIKAGSTRLEDSLRALGEGRSATELFPDEMYAAGKGPRH